MPVTAFQLIEEAYRQTSIIPNQTNTFPNYYATQGLALLNRIIGEWGGDTTCIPFQSVLNFNFVANQEGYTFGLGDQYDVNTAPIVDVISVYFYLNPDTNTLRRRIIPMSEMEYSNIPYIQPINYPSQYLVRRFVDYTELLFQSIPAQTFPVTVVCKQQLQPVELTDSMQAQLSPQFLLNLKNRLVYYICKANGVPLDPDFINEVVNTDKTMRAGNPLDLSLLRTEDFGNRNNRWWGTGYWGVN